MADLHPSSDVVEPAAAEQNVNENGSTEDRAGDGANGQPVESMTPSFATIGSNGYSQVQPFFKS
jgi:hypothetical protein